MAESGGAGLTGLARRQPLLMGVIVRDWAVRGGAKGYGRGGVWVMVVVATQVVYSNDNNASRWGRGGDIAQLSSSPDVVRVELRKKKRNVCGSPSEKELERA